MKAFSRSEGEKNTKVGWERLCGSNKIGISGKTISNSVKVCVCRKTCVFNADDFSIHGTQFLNNDTKNNSKFPKILIFFIKLF